jgi:cytochrome c oxidase cbb3-type subunit 1
MAGLFQGYYWASLQPWEASTIGSYPFWVTRVFAGLMMFAGFLCFLANLRATFAAGRSPAGASGSLAASA